MAGFIQVIPDPLSKNNPNLSGQTGDAIDSGTIPKYDHIRRPVRGLMLKEETFVTLEVKTKDGKNLLLVDAGGSIEKGDVSYTPKYSNFLIQSISESSMEKSQIIETFGPAFVFFFGQRPRMLNVNGVLLNSADFNWRQEWWANYETYLRGTQLVATNTKVYISYEDFIIIGYLMSCSTEQTADPTEYIPFNFQLLISSVINTSIVGSSNFPYFTPVNLEPDVVVVQNSEAPELNAGTDNIGTFANIVNDALRGNISTDLLYGPNAQKYSSYIVQYITGSNIKVPVGISGSIVFDEVQTPKFIYGTFQGYNTTEVKYGKIKDNTDEYVARNKQAGNPGKVTVTTPSARAQQYADGQKQDELAKKRLKELGIDITPPSRLKQLAVTGAFATLNLAGSLTRMLSPTDPTADLLVNGSVEKGLSDRGGR